MVNEKKKKEEKGSRAFVLIFNIIYLHRNFTHIHYMAAKVQVLFCVCSTRLFTF